MTDKKGSSGNKAPPVKKGPSKQPAPSRPLRESTGNFTKKGSVDTTGSTGPKIPKK